MAAALEKPVRGALATVTDRMRIFANEKRRLCKGFLAAGSGHDIRNPQMVLKVLRGGTASNAWRATREASTCG